MRIIHLRPVFLTDHGLAACATSRQVRQRLYSNTAGQRNMRLPICDWRPREYRKAVLVFDAQVRTGYLTWLRVHRRPYQERCKYDRHVAGQTLKCSRDQSGSSRDTHRVCSDVPEPTTSKMPAGSVVRALPYKFLKRRSGIEAAHGRKSSFTRNVNLFRSSM